jgi:hypothetical protein
MEVLNFDPFPYDGNIDESEDSTTTPTNNWTLKDLCNIIVISRGNSLPTPNLWQGHHVSRGDGRFPACVAILPDIYNNWIEVSKKIREGQTTDPIVIPLDSLSTISFPFLGDVYSTGTTKKYGTCQPLSLTKSRSIIVKWCEMSSCPAPPAKRKLRSERRVFGFLDDFMRKKWWSSPENGHMELIWVWE